MANTEKPQTIAQKKQEGVVQKKVEKLEQTDMIQQKEEKKVDEKVDNKETKVEEKKEKKKQPAKKIKKDEVAVNVTGAHVSTKYAIAICEFVRRKRIEDAIADLENVLVKKMHIPMRGEYAHKRGAGKVASGAGKYPQDATKQFIILLKSLLSNAHNHDVEEPVIVEAIANFGNRPMGRFGRWQRKRTNIKLVAREAKSAGRRNKNLKKAKKKFKKSKKKFGGKK